MNKIKFLKWWDIFSKIYYFSKMWKKEEENLFHCLVVESKSPSWWKKSRVLQKSSWITKERHTLPCSGESTAATQKRGTFLPLLDRFNIFYFDTKFVGRKCWMKIRRKSRSPHCSIHNQVSLTRPTPSRSRQDTVIYLVWKKKEDRRRRENRCNVFNLSTADRNKNTLTKKKNIITRFIFRFKSLEE